MAQISWPTGFKQRDLVGWGNFGAVVLDSSSGNTVVKFPLLDEHNQHIRVEKAIYERFRDQGGHIGLLQYLGHYESGLRLQFAENYGLRKYIQDHGNNLTSEQRLRWCQQIAEAVAFIHSNCVIHGALTAGNIFLDKDLNAKVADFAGSSLDGSPLLVAVTSSHRYPGSLLSKQADIFALGSTIFEVMSGRTPYDGYTDKDIQDFFGESKYPKTKWLGPIGDVITNCWQGVYPSADKVSSSIKALRYVGNHPLSSSQSHLKIPVSAIVILAFGLLVISWVARSWATRLVHS